VLGKSTAVESAEHDESRLAFHQGRYRGLRPLTENQIAFPVTGNGAIIGFRRPFADQHHVLQLTGAGRSTQGSPLGPSRAQALGQFLAQRPAPLHKQRLVNRLVRHAHLQVIWEGYSPSRCNLLRRPSPREASLNLTSQPWRGRELRQLRPV
jgi:hypothetical protein